MPEQQRLIKKYPNRRLYDTRTSSYITLADVKDWCSTTSISRSWMRRPARI
jgi:polyhydroxyalkanoate synthesis regulator protein